MQEALSLYSTKDFREFLRNWVGAQTPKRGQLTRMSEGARIHKTTLSQILAGTKEIQLEQAFQLAKYIGLSRKETDYFLLLVQFSRAALVELRELFEFQIEAQQKQNLQLVNRVTRSRELSSEERSIYYSNWMYSCVRNLSAIPGFQYPKTIAQRFHLEPNLLSEILAFLLKTGLCIQENGQIKPGPQMTHLESSSPLVVRHHGNFRLKAMENHPKLKPTTELAYTAPMTLSREDAQKIKKVLVELVERTDKIVGPSPSETLFCLCLDWFEI